MIIENREQKSKKYLRSENENNIMTKKLNHFTAVFFWLPEPTPDWFAKSTPIVVILLAVVADVASVGSRIAVEKDWIVVIAGGDNDQLARFYFRS